MQLLPRHEDLRVKQVLIPWAPHATNAPALRSLLLQQGDQEIQQQGDKETQLYVQHQQPPDCSCSDKREPSNSAGSSYVVVKLPHQHRFMLIGDAQANPDYEDACHGIIRILMPQQEESVADSQQDHPSSHHQQAAVSQQPQPQPQQQVIRLRAVPTAGLQQVRTAFSKAGYEELYCSPGLQYIVADDSLKQQLLAPDLQQQLLEQIRAEQYEFEDLQPEDADYVNDNWIYRAPGSLAQIQQVITNSSRHTSCIRQMPSRQLVSWALEMEPGYLGILHTVEQHRRKGLGKAVLLSLLSKLYKAYLQEDAEVQQRLTHTADCGAISTDSCCTCSQNGDCSTCSKVQTLPIVGMCTDGESSCWPGGAVYCYVMQGNRPSVALLESVGLVRTQECWWMGFGKK